MDVYRFGQGPNLINGPIEPVQLVQQQQQQQAVPDNLLVRGGFVGFLDGGKSPSSAAIQSGHSPFHVGFVSLGGGYNPWQPMAEHPFEWMVVLQERIGLPTPTRGYFKKSLGYTHSPPPSYAQVVTEPLQGGLPRRDPAGIALIRALTGPKRRREQLARACGAARIQATPWAVPAPHEQDDAHALWQPLLRPEALAPGWNMNDTLMGNRQCDTWVRHWSGRGANLILPYNCVSLKLNHMLPDNMDELGAVLDRDDQLPATREEMHADFGEFTDRMSRLRTERDVMLDMILMMLDDDSDCEYNGIFGQRMDAYGVGTCGFNEELPPPWPDYVAGFKSSEYHAPPLQRLVYGCLPIPGSRHALTLPHFAGEWKSPDADLAQARMRAAYIGAMLTYSRNAALLCVNERRRVDRAEVLTFAIDGVIIEFYAHHMGWERGRPTAFQSCIYRVDLTASAAEFERGCRYLRNAQAWAKKMSIEVRALLQDRWRHDGEAAFSHLGASPSFWNSASWGATFGQDQQDRPDRPPANPPPPPGNPPGPSGMPPGPPMAFGPGAFGPGAAGSRVRNHDAGQPAPDWGTYGNQTLTESSEKAGQRGYFDRQRLRPHVPRGVQDAPAEVQYAPVTAQHAPAAECAPEGVQHAPAATQDAPVVTEFAPMVVEDTPKVAQDALAVVDEAPAEVRYAPMAAQDAPEQVQHAPAAEDAPAAGYHASMVVHHALMAVPYVPMRYIYEAGYVPAEVRNAPVADEDAPEAAHDTLAQVQPAPEQVQHAPAAEHAPAQAEDAPAEVQYAPEQVQHVPEHVQHAPMEAQEAPMVAEDALAEVEDAPAEVQDTPVAVQAALGVEAAFAGVEDAPVVAQPTPMAAQDPFALADKVLLVVTPEPEEFVGEEDAPEAAQPAHMHPALRDPNPQSQPQSQPQSPMPHAGGAGQEEEDSDSSDDEEQDRVEPGAPYRERSEDEFDDGYGGGDERNQDAYEGDWEHEHDFEDEEGYEDEPDGEDEGHDDGPEDGEESTNSDESADSDESSDDDDDRSEGIISVEVVVVDEPFAPGLVPVPAARQQSPPQALVLDHELEQAMARPAAEPPRTPEQRAAAEAERVAQYLAQLRYVPEPDAFVFTPRSELQLQMARDGRLSTLRAEISRQRAGRHWYPGYNADQVDFVMQRRQTALRRVMKGKGRDWEAEEGGREALAREKEVDMIPDISLYEEGEVEPSVAAGKQPARQESSSFWLNMGSRSIYRFGSSDNLGSRSNFSYNPGFSSSSNIGSSSSSSNNIGSSSSSSNNIGSSSNSSNNIGSGSSSGSKIGSSSSSIYTFGSGDNLRSSSSFSYNPGFSSSSNIGSSSSSSSNLGSGSSSSSSGNIGFNPSNNIGSSSSNSIGSRSMYVFGSSHNLGSSSSSSIGSSSNSNIGSSSSNSMGFSFSSNIGPSSSSIYEFGSSSSNSMEFSFSSNIRSNSYNSIESSPNSNFRSSSFSSIESGSSSNTNYSSSDNIGSSSNVTWQQTVLANCDECDGPCPHIEGPQGKGKRKADAPLECSRSKHVRFDLPSQSSPKDPRRKTGTVPRGSFMEVVLFDV